MRGVDDPAVAKLKGDVRMVKVLARAVRTRQRPLRHDVEIPFGAGVLRLRAQTTEEIVAAARRRPGTHNARRRFVEAQVVRAARRRVPGPAHPRRRQRRPRTPRPPRSRTTWRSGCAASPRWSRRSTACGRASRPTSSSTTSSGRGPCWRRRARASSARAEVAAAVPAPRARSLDAVPWTVGDTALIDEARTLLGPRRLTGPTRARAQRADEGAVAETGFWPQGLAASPAPSAVTVNGLEDEIRSSATSWSTRCRTSHRCSCACWRAGRSRAP